MKTLNYTLKTALLCFFIITQKLNAQAPTANFIYSVNPNGVVTFTSTSTGTDSTTNYAWHFGDNLFSVVSGSNAQTSFTYANGTYYVDLHVYNNGVTTNSTGVTQTVVVTTATNSGCNLVANFSSTLSTTDGHFMIGNTSTGTTGGTSYLIDFGDGTPAAQNMTHQYPFNGTFTVSMTADNHFTPACISTKTAVIVVNTATCGLIPGYSATHINGNTLQYINTATASYPLSCYWNFGDGTTANGDTVTHIYAQNGTYNVEQMLIGGSSCVAYSIQPVVVTGTACVANSNFTLVPTGSPKFWNAFPTYPFNVSNAKWNWGDGTTSNTLYSSHVYSVASTYFICLSVTVSCGDTSTTCSSYYVFKSGDNTSSDMIGITVLKPAATTSIKNNQSESIAFNLYPNPNNGEFNITLSENTKPTSLIVYNIVGKVVHSEKLNDPSSNEFKTIKLYDLDSGIYFVQLSSDSKTFTRKIVINH